MSAVKDAAELIEWHERWIKAALTRNFDLFTSEELSFFLMFAKISNCGFEESISICIDRIKNTLYNKAHFL